MKILHTVESYYPSTGGMPEVVKQLSERLVKLGHEVTVAAMKHSDRETSKLNGVCIEEFDISGNMVHGFTGTESEIGRYQEYLINSDSDIIVNFAAQQWATDLMLPVMNKIKSKKVMVPTGFSGLFMEEYRNYYKKMAGWLKEYDMLVFLSNDYRDINFAKDYRIEKFIIIPNGAGEDEFNIQDSDSFRNLLDIDDNDFLILHVGSHTGAKGHREAIEIFKKADIKDAVFLIVGNYPDKHNNSTDLITILKSKARKTARSLLHKTGLYTINCPDCCHEAEKLNSSKDFLDKNKRIYIRELPRLETVKAYHAADLFLFPSNIECSPIVLFECMASRTPFLVTDVGNSKEIIEWSEGGELLPTTETANGFCRALIDESAIALERYYRHKELRDTKAAAGFLSWQNRFTWEKITKDYEEMYFKIIR